MIAIGNRDRRRDSSAPITAAIENEGEGALSGATGAGGPGPGVTSAISSELKDRDTPFSSSRTRDGDERAVVVVSIDGKDESIAEVCMYCGAYGGHLKRCGGCDSSDPSTGDGGPTRCSTVFHPLCAWFQGVFLETSITDPTFQGMYDRIFLFRFIVAFFSMP